jgi:hypothetical protein
MTDFERRVIEMYLNHPTDYKDYLHLYNNPDHAYRLIQKLIPTDTGIEWEMGPRMVFKLREVKRNNEESTNQRIHSWMNDLMFHPYEHYEVDMRIRNHTKDAQIKKLSEMYAYMNKPFNDENRVSKSGIHIHVNITSFWDHIYYNHEIINKTVRSVARGFFNYKGDYNDLMFNTQKGFAIIFRRDFKTIEYRCINMTYNFRTLLKYIIFCHYATPKFMVMLNRHSSDEAMQRASAKIISFGNRLKLL